MIKYRNMKKKLFLLLPIISAFGVNYAGASECIGPECEIKPVMIEHAKKLKPTIIEEQILIPETKPVCDNTCKHDYNCPFDTAEECAVWYKKPVYKQNVYPRAPHFSSIKMDEILYGINSNSEISANDSFAKPLLERYQMLQMASKSCCTAGIVYKMKLNGKDEESVYDFIKDDVNYFAVGSRCLMTTNDEITNKYSNGVDGEMVSDVRNACLCKNREWFEKLLAPFKDVYKRAPQFEPTPFNYTYTDGMQREITISVNQDVQNTLNLLSQCPD